MTIRIESLIPLPLLEQQRNHSDIWAAASVEFPAGETFLIEAPSGKGKTSLLSIVYGLRRDFRGKVWLDGEDIATWSGKQWSQLRKQKLSYIFQGLELFDELTALEMVTVPYDAADTEATVNESPSASVSLTNTEISTAVSSAVVALSSTAAGP